jgi:CrcB protein
MKQFIAVFIGGGLGSLARFLVSRFYAIWQPTFPLATLTANFISCLIFGVFVAFGLEKSNLNYPLKSLIITGFCGGFSTYSAFTFETFEFFKSGQNGLALGNIVLNFVISMSGLYVGMMVSKLV